LDTSCCGIAFTWKRTENEDELQPFAVIADARGVRDLTMDFGYEADWQYAKELTARAQASGEVADGARAESFTRRLLRRRQHDQRMAAAEIARSYAVVCVQKIDLSGKGAKLHTAPASFRLALKHALESRGGALVAIALPRGEMSAAEHAKALLKSARAAAK